MSAEILTLPDLASKKFNDLRPAERRLLESAGRGQWTPLPKVIGGDAEDAAPKPKPAAAGDYTVRAEVLSWLCTDKQAAALVTNRGVLISGGEIEGELDLSFASIPFPINIKECAIPGGVRLEYATVGNLSLTGCRTGAVWAVWLTAHRDVTLSDGFRSDGGVNLNRARIAGDLYCSGGTFVNPAGSAISVLGSRIDGDVWFLDGFHAEGEVNFMASVIEGSLVCANSQFHNPDVEDSGGLHSNRKAIAGDRARVGKGIFLRNGVEIVGEASLIGATTHGDLDCGAARFINPGKFALSADRIIIAGDIFFTRGFETNGILRLPSAEVGGEVNFTGASFTGERTNGASLENATVKRAIYWREVKKTDKTRLVLDDTTAASFHDHEKSWPADGQLSVFGFKYGRISGVPTAERRRKWLELQPKERRVNLQPYEQLAAVLQAAGHDSESRKVLIAKEDARYKYGGMGRVSRVWGRVLKVTLGYGYTPRRALIWILGVVLLGWLVFWAGHANSLFSPISDGLYKDAAFQNGASLPSGYQTFNPFVYSLDAFLPIIDLHQEAVWLPNPSRPCVVAGGEHPCGAYLRIYLWAHIIVGWALSTLAVAGFTGLVRKD